MMYAFTLHARVDVEVTHAQITIVTQCGVITTAGNGLCYISGSCRTYT